MFSEQVFKSTQQYVSEVHTREHICVYIDSHSDKEKTETVTSCSVLLLMKNVPQESEQGQDVNSRDISWKKIIWKYDFYVVKQGNKLFDCVGFFFLAMLNKFYFISKII